VGIELNTATFGFANEEEEQAVVDFYAHAKDCGCKFFFGSDAHGAHHFAHHPPRAQRMADRLFKRNACCALHHKVLAVTINIDDLDKLYKEKDRNDIYYITLQLLMENYAHFLSMNDGVGSIYLETTDWANNAKLQNLFHLLKATGTLFITKEMLQLRLSTINFSIKSDNNIGLQLADFVPNPLARAALGKKQKAYSIYDEIVENLYDGKIGLKERFGFKIIK